jgi:ribosome-binding factor A
MDSTRQKKINSLLIKDLSEIFRKNSPVYAQGKMISVSEVRITPDLSLASVYLSIFPSSEKELVLKNIETATREIRHELSQKVKLQLRKVPELRFYIDNTIDNMEKIDDLLKK